MSLDFHKAPDDISLKPLQIHDVRIVFGAIWKPLNIVTEDGQKVLQVNTSRYDSLEQAKQEAMIEVTTMHMLHEMLQNSEYLWQISQKNISLSELRKALRSRAIRQCYDRYRSEFPTNLPLPTSRAGQYQWAWDRLVVWEDLPDTLDTQVREAVLGRQHGEDDYVVALSDSRTPESYLAWYRPIAEDIARFREQDSKSTIDGSWYRPSLNTGTEAPMEEGDIETRVTPFLGKYYRERVYDTGYTPGWDTLEIDASDARVFDIDLDLDTLQDKKRYTYSTLFPPKPPRTSTLPIPPHALPLVSTLTPWFELVRDGAWVWALQQTDPRELSERMTVQFEFVVTKSPQEVFQLKNEKKQPFREILPMDPPENHSSSLWGQLDDETQQFLTDIRTLGLTPRWVARRVQAYVRQKFTYPDETQRTIMNTKYSTAHAANNLFSSMCEYGIADCHWSNIFFWELMKRLDISHRIVGGYFIQKDSRFDFAPVWGIGHAWSEIWDGDEWILCDATPPGEHNQEKDWSGEETQEDEDMDRESGDNLLEEILIEEEVQALYEELLDKMSENIYTPEDPILPDGVKTSEWQAVERYLQKQLARSVPAEQSISGWPSTIEQELNALFDVIYEERKLPKKVTRWPVRQSVGDILTDPVQAHINVVTGQIDPSGWSMDTTREKKIREISRFEDDMILDLTSSMSESGAINHQKSMVMTSLYTLMRINDRLRRAQRELRTPLQIRSHVGSFQGDTTTTLYQTSGQDIDRRLLCQLFKSLDSTETGRGDLLASLQQYEQGIIPEQKNALKQWELKKVLTICTDGAVDHQEDIVTIIARLRALWIIVQWIGFWDSAQQLRVICHDEKNPDAAVILDDVSQATLARHKMLMRVLWPQKSA